MLERSSDVAWRTAGGQNSRPCSPAGADGLTRLRGAKNEVMSSSTSVLSWAEATEARRAAVSGMLSIGGAAEICMGTRRSMEPPRPAVCRERDKARVYVRLIKHEWNVGTNECLVLGRVMGKINLAVQNLVPDV